MPAYANQDNVPIISVIVPVRDAVSTLPRCIDSVLAQTAEGLELIIVDDGSADGSLELAEGYVKSHPGVVRLIRPERGGVSAARNAGLGAARGRYIGFVDSDDHIAPAMYENLLRLMESGAGAADSAGMDDGSDDGAGSGAADLAVCAKYIESCGVLRVKEHAKLLRGNRDVAAGTPEQLGFLLEHISNFVWDKLMRADIIRDNGIRFPEPFSYSEDFAFLAVYLSYAKRAAFTDEPYYYYNTGNPASISNVPSARWLEAFGSFESVIEDFRRRGLPEPVVASVCRVAFRTYDHRVNSFYRFARKDIQRGYIQAGLGFFDRIIPDWRNKVARESGVLFPGVKSSPFLMRLYVAAPNALKSLVMRPIEKAAMRGNPPAKADS
jgi:glycosyltransferase involved in cell wall biosynthesis